MPENPESILSVSIVAAGAVAVLLALALPLLGLKTGMPGITVLPEDEQARQGYDMIADGFGPGGPGPIQVIVPADQDAEAVAGQVMATEGIVMAFPPQPGMEGASIIQAVGAYDPSSDEALALMRQAADAGAQVLATACPWCLIQLEDAVKTAGLEGGLRVGYAPFDRSYEVAFIMRHMTDEVFRTVALEPSNDRRHNPGLPATHGDNAEP